MKLELQTLLPSIRTGLPGPAAQKVIARDARSVSPSYTRPYPLVVKRGAGAMLEDVDGNLFLDFNAGIAVCATGHSHPDVVKAIQEQAAEFVHMSGTDFYYEIMVTLAEQLGEIAPGAFPKKAYFGNSGTEAIEAAMKLARFHTGRKYFVAFYNCFHGRTYGALSLTSSKPVQRAGFGPFLSGVVHVPYANCYRCPYNLEYDQCGIACADFIPNTLFKTVVPPNEVAAIVLEPVQGEGGYIFPPKEFFSRLQEIASKHGILLIVDEVQSGMGRTGKWWASDHYDFVPDILAVAKGVASGLPLGVILARDEIMSWGPGSHASTFGGNPVSCAAALATLRLLKEGLMENCREQGACLKDRLQKLRNTYEIVGDVRGLGLMLALEIVKDKRSKEPDPERRNRIVAEMFRRGVLVLGCGESSVRLSPPLVINREQAEFAADTLDEVLRAVS
ncbi:MAG: acetyl ornithine aminotransferase family protein [Acidobacteria bacterium]|nr:acetyl ornithine aminotransferase family protein [Acidobacteriota bacterium]